MSREFSTTYLTKVETGVYIEMLEAREILQSP